MSAPSSSVKELRQALAQRFPDVVGKGKKADGTKLLPPVAFSLSEISDLLNEPDAAAAQSRVIQRAEHYFLIRGRAAKKAADKSTGKRKYRKRGSVNPLIAIGGGDFAGNVNGASQQAFLDQPITITMRDLLHMVKESINIFGS